MEIYENSRVETGITLKQHTTKVFVWMFVGLLITFVTALALGSNEELVWSIFGSEYGRMLSIGIFIAQIGVAIAFGARLMKMNANAAKALFLAYSILTGVTFSTLAFTFEVESIAMAFGAAAIFFGSLVTIGYTTKMDLSKIGSICYAGLFALIIYSVFTMFFGSFEGSTYIISIIGLALFVGITAWDTQKMKRMYVAYQNDEKTLGTLAIFSAFQLYLDFINIFLYILRLVGNRR